MQGALELEASAADFLDGNRSLYAARARRKKLGLIGFRVLNRTPAEVRIDLGSSRLLCGGQSREVEAPRAVIRSLSEFTWDFLVYLILSFHPLLAAVDLFFFLGGPLYNRSLRRKLRALVDGTIVIAPGEAAEGLLGFRKVPRGPAVLRLAYAADGSGPRQIELPVAPATVENKRP